MTREAIIGISCFKPTSRANGTAFQSRHPLHISSLSRTTFHMTSPPPPPHTFINHRDRRDMLRPHLAREWDGNVLPAKNGRPRGSHTRSCHPPSPPPYLHLVLAVGPLNRIPHEDQQPDVRNLTKKKQQDGGGAGGQFRVEKANINLSSETKTSYLPGCAHSILRWAARSGHGCVAGCREG